MLDANGKYTILDFNTAQGLAIADAAAVGITVASGSGEEQIANYLAQFDVSIDNSIFQSYQLQFNPVGADIDLQNPNTPRLQASVSNGYLLLTNGTGAPVTVNINTIFTAPNGNAYTTGNNSVTVLAHSTNTISVYSSLTGIAQNLPANQSFTGGGFVPATSLTATNPQPFTDGRDIESDTLYTNRIIYLKTNNTSQQATAATLKELNVYYRASQLYVNNTSNALPNPLPVPPNGYVCVVEFPSGPAAGPAEIQRALQIIANRLEFGNTNNNSTTLHPVLGGTIYTGPFPENFYVCPAQAVQSTLTATVSVRFNANLDASEKAILANAFATFFAQNVVTYFGGAAGNATCIFTPITSPPSTVTTSLPILAQLGIIQPTIGPAFSIEQVRALISDEVELASMVNMEYLSCSALTLTLDPLQAGQPTVVLDISGNPSTVTSVDFKSTALFVDGTAWYDRYMYIDPARITISVLEHV